MTIDLKPCPFCLATNLHDDDCWFTLRDIGASKARLNAAWNRRASAPPVILPTDAILAARAEGRAEALEILTRLDAEGGIDSYTGWGKSGAPEDEGSAYWEVEKLRDLFGCDDKLFNLFERAECMHWEATGKAFEADRMMSMVKSAPFYKPLHDFLAKHEAWDLMGQLQTAAAAPALQEGSEQPLEHQQEGQPAALRAALAEFVALDDLRLWMVKHEYADHTWWFKQKKADYENRLPFVMQAARAVLAPVEQTTSTDTNNEKGQA